MLARRTAAALDAALSVLDRAADCSGSNLAIAARVRVGALRSLGRLSEADTHVAEMQELAKQYASPENQARADMEVAQLRLAQGRGAEGVPFAHRALATLAPSQVATSALLQTARRLVVACEECVAFSNGI